MIEVLKVNIFDNCFLYRLAIDLIHEPVWEHSGTVLDLRPMSQGFEPHRRHCVVSLSKTHLSLLSTGSTHEDPSLGYITKTLLTGA